MPKGPQPYAPIIDGSFGIQPTPTNTSVPPTVTATTVPSTPTNTAVPTAATNTPVPAPMIHIGDLDGSSVAAARGKWNAVVTITLHDSSEAPVASVR
ncbi:MAG: hypothetical protein ACK2U5_13960 [Candidatus Promineifilaceae bacterium]